MFAIKLTPPELGAAIHAFDKDGDGSISCPEFLRTFFRLGEDEKKACWRRGQVLVCEKWGTRVACIEDRGDGGALFLTNGVCVEPLEW